MMNLNYHTCKLLFWLNRQRGRNQKAAIYLRVTINAKRVELATHQFIEPLFWSSKAQCAKGDSQEVTIINRQLRKMKAELQGHYSALSKLGAPISAEVLKNRFLKIEEKQYTLKDALDFYIRLFIEKVRVGNRAVNTLKSINTCSEKLCAFVRSHFNAGNIKLENIKSSFVSNFQHYLIVNDRLGNNTAMKYIKIFKRVLKMTVKEEWIKINPANSFKCSYYEPQRERLTMDEIMVLYRKDLLTDRLIVTKDVYLFCCFTGFAYHDVLKLNSDNIVTGIDREKWVQKNRKKNNSIESLPLLPVAAEIIEKYKFHPCRVNKNQLLPVDTNQRFNYNLKKIAAICGINKRLTTHTARHTFATTITLEHDVPIETVSQMLVTKVYEPPKFMQRLHNARSAII